MTDKQILQSLLRDFFICLVCGKPGSRLCEMHAADERTEIERQTIQTRWNRQVPRI